MPDPAADTPEPDAPLRIRPLAERKNLVQKEDFAKVLPPVDGFLTWFEALPEIYGSKSLKHVVSEIVTAREHGREVGVQLGAATQRDFWTFCDAVGRLEQGVWLNVGSAVIMPEVFLKAVSIARNKGQLTDDFLTCNFDMLQQYRAVTNVVQRPPRQGRSILAMHEIVLPLLHQALICTAHARGVLREAR